MAKWALLFGLIILIVGCQSHQQMVENLPAPNFNGPIILPQARPTPPAVVQLPPPQLPQARPQPKSSLAGIPAAWIPNAGAHRDRPGSWDYIVIHHSATPTGSVADFNREHKQKGWDECGYDFVIGNGSHSGNGQVEVGPRWPIQKHGAHAFSADERFNDHGIGICLVGDFEVDHPTAAQMQSLTRLVAYLMRAYNIPTSRIIGHEDAKHIVSSATATLCPGRYLSIPAIRKAAAQQIALADTADAPDALATSSELLSAKP